MGWCGSTGSAMEGYAGFRVACRVAQDAIMSLLGKEGSLGDRREWVTCMSQGKGSWQVGWRPICQLQIHHQCTLRTKPDLRPRGWVLFSVSPSVKLHIHPALLPRPNKSSARARGKWRPKCAQDSQPPLPAVSFKS